LIRYNDGEKGEAHLRKALDHSLNFELAEDSSAQFNGAPHTFLLSSCFSNVRLTYKVLRRDWPLTRVLEQFNLVPI
jgi:hypothetical protein